jgi:hypothetical protein
MSYFEYGTDALKIHLKNVAENKQHSVFNSKSLAR